MVFGNMRLTNRVNLEGMRWKRFGHVRRAGSEEDSVKPTAAERRCGEVRLSRKKPRVAHRNWLYQGFLKLREDILHYDSGARTNWLTVESTPAAVCVLAVSSNGGVLIQREYRHSVGEFVTGLPGGKVELGEDVLEAAARELREETGLVFEKWGVLGESWPLPGIFNQKTVFVKAENLVEECEMLLEAGEVIAGIEFKSCNDLLELATLHGEPVDGQLLAGLSLMYAKCGSWM